METRFDAKDRLSAMSTGTKIALPAAILLFIDLFLPWQDFGNELTEGVGLDLSVNGWHGFWGILLGLVTLVLIVWLGLQVAGVDLSGVNLPVTHAMITLGVGVLLLAVAIIKLLTILGDEATIWAYIGIVLAAVAAYGAYHRSREMEGLAPAGSGGGTSSGTSGYGGPASSGTPGAGPADDDLAPPPAPPPTTTTGGPTSTPGLGGDPTPEAPPEYRPGGTTPPPPRDEP
jgi:hypothetical protein